MSATVRELVSCHSGLETSDGDGVNMVRVIGTPQLNVLDPFLLLDAFSSDEPQDYIGGFPPHPHRGFETVTYLLAGKMRHKDNMGNEGVLESGGVQWMTAGKGVVHSEMPEQEDGLLKGFQLWVNLPAHAKMVKPAYQEFPPSEIPVEHQNEGIEVRVIAGTTDKGTAGPIQNAYVNPSYMDVRLQEGQAFQQLINPADNTFLFVVEGSIDVGQQAQALTVNQLGVLDKGEKVFVKAESGSAHFLLVSGMPLNEPIARGGPFVMNTKDEVNQAFDDFRNNRF